MRQVLALVMLALALPHAHADSVRGASAGVNLGYAQPGVWDAWWYDHPGGALDLALSWERALLPADYDLRLYAPGALHDGTLRDHELVAQSRTRSFDAHEERIALDAPAGRYVVAVVPYQALCDAYTLTSAAGDLGFAALAPGVTATSP